MGQDDGEEMGLVDAQNILCLDEHCHETSNRPRPTPKQEIVTKVGLLYTSLDDSVLRKCMGG